jgi:hypothetical protein
MNAAPDYAPALAKQRDAFQRADAVARAWTSSSGLAAATR